MGAELAQVVAELTERVVVLAETVARQEVRVQLPRRPIAEQATGVEEAIEHADDAVIVQLDPGDAARAGRHGARQRGQRAPVDGGVEQFRLLREVAVGRGGQVLLDRGQVVELAADGEVVGRVR